MSGPRPSCAVRPSSDRRVSISTSIAASPPQQMIRTRGVQDQPVRPVRTPSTDTSAAPKAPAGPAPARSPATSAYSTCRSGQIARISTTRAPMRSPPDPGGAVGGMDHRAVLAFDRQHHRHIIRRRVARPFHRLLPPLHREMGQINRHDPPPVIAGHPLPGLALARAEQFHLPTRIAGGLGVVRMRAARAARRLASGRAPHSDRGWRRAGSASRAVPLASARIASRLVAVKLSAGGSPQISPITADRLCATQPVLHRPKHIGGPGDIDPQYRSQRVEARQIGPPRFLLRQTVLHPQNGGMIAVPDTGQHKSHRPGIDGASGKDFRQSMRLASILRYPLNPARRMPCHRYGRHALHSESHQMFFVCSNKISRSRQTFR